MNQEQYAYSRLQELTNNGVEATIENQIKFNAGGVSESTKHLIVKGLASKIMAEHGWTVNSEVETPNGDVDVLAYGNEGYLSYAIEVEQNNYDGLTSEYVEQYIYPTPIDELIIISIDNTPNKLDRLMGYVEEQLPIQ